MRDNCVPRASENAIVVTLGLAHHQGWMKEKGMLEAWRTLFKGKIPKGIRIIHYDVDWTSKQKEDIKEHEHERVEENYFSPYLVEQKVKKVYIYNHSDLRNVNREQWSSTSNWGHPSWKGREYKKYVWDDKEYEFEGKKRLPNESDGITIFSICSDVSLMPDKIKNDALKDLLEENDRLRRDARKDLLEEMLRKREKTGSDPVPAPSDHHSCRLF